MTRLIEEVNCTEPFPFSKGSMLWHLTTDLQRPAEVWQLVEQPTTDPEIEILNPKTARQGWTRQSYPSVKKQSDKISNFNFGKK